MRAQFMKKSGFTLSELLVTLCVIGVVAAITAPILSGLMPDKNKVEVLKTYKIISDTNRELLEDPSLNWRMDMGGDPCDNGLWCTGVPFNPKYKDHRLYSLPNTKYPYLFASKLELADGPSDISTDPITFETTDGKLWAISILESEGGEDLGFTVNVKLDKNSAKDCVYSEDCKKPDTFQFYVDKGGGVLGNDPLTTAYLRNKSKLNDKKNDYATAAADTTKYKTHYTPPITPY